MSEMKTQIDCNYDELRDENESLFTDLSYCQKLFKLLENFRKLAQNYHKMCKCRQNMCNKSIGNQLEKQFGNLYDRRRVFQIKNRINNRFKINSLKSKKCNNLAQSVSSDRIKVEEKSGSENDEAMDDSCGSAGEEPTERFALKQSLALKRLKARKRGTGKRVRKNLTNQELMDGLRHKLFVEVLDTQIDLISVIRRKENTKSEEEFDFGPIVGFRCTGIGCRFLTYRKDSMRGHINAKHSNERPFGCDECEKTFTTKKYLDSHKANQHSDDPKLKCDYSNCSYETKYQSQMSTHIMRHRNDRAFKCDQCESGFCSKGDLNIHKRLVHEGHRPYQCEWPGCESRFKTVSAFNVHKTVHSSDKAFVCDVGECQMCFSTKNNLKRHKESHDLVKRHVCCWPACDRSFARKYRLDSHMKKHTMTDQKLHFQHISQSINI